MWLSRKTRKGKGSSLPGKIALKICPQILGILSRQVRHGVVVVTGTNGKTTTNNMVARGVSAAGYQVVVNHEGANLITGVTTALIRKSSLWGRVNCDYALLEVDEAAFPVVTRQVQPALVVVTNFFRDQLDRYGELDRTVGQIGQVLAQMPGTQLVLNGDDPLVAQLKKVTGLPAVFYGLGEDTGSSRQVEFGTREARFCPLCGHVLVYKYYHYSQLGNYSCPGCGFARPVAQVEAVEINFSTFSTSCLVRFFQEGISLMLPVHGIYNLYNALAAFAAGLLLGIAPEVIVSSLQGYIPATGRMERFNYQGKPVLLNLVKNPAGFNEGLRALLTWEGKMDVFIAINDNDADGRDISWLWDVDFEVLEKNHDRFNVFWCSGSRAEEMGVRLKYAGVPVSKILVETSLSSAVRQVLDAPGEIAWLLATYTALWPVEKILKKYARREEGNAARLSSLP